MSVTEHLKPEKVFHYFEQICGIPHGSGNVDELSDYLAGFAKERDLFYIQDEMKNIIIIKEAVSGYEDVPPIILQGHMDMVAVKKPAADIDMSKDGLRLKVEGDYLYAEDTSLGGDDGIAVAYALAILDADDLLHPRLEIVITVDEEVGMDGARKLDASALEGKRMLNLDSEEEGIIIAGCAGGARVDWKMPVTWENRSGSLYRIDIKGLLGGHSGTEIDKERGNANCLMGRLFTEIYEKMDFSVAALTGGLADNAIPREASATVVVNEDNRADFLETLKGVEAEIKCELQTKDPGFFMEVTKLEEKECQCLEKAAVNKLSYLLFCAPAGVQGMSGDMEGIVETSLNMGIINLEKEGLAVQFSVRSSLESAKKALIKKLEKIAENADAKQEIRGDYPGWAYRKNSPLRDTASDIYSNMYGHEPEIQAIHAGLECGILMEKIPDLECIAIGPDMKDIHTTEERLSISSTERIWNYVLEILKQK